MDAYRAQRRGGRGITALPTKSEDFVEQLFVASTHSTVLFFTNRGRVYRLRGHEIPEASRSARGTAIINLLNLDPGERIQATIPIAEYSEDLYLVMATRQGVIKKTSLSEFANLRSAGLICISLDEDDELIGVELTDGSKELMLVTRYGQAIRFAETDVRPMGRSARGVKGITLERDDAVVGLGVVTNDREVLVVTENGFGKRTPVEEYRITGRGGKGIKTLNMTLKTGPIVGIRLVQESDEVMIISLEGIMIRIPVSDISRQGRSTQGVTLMRLDAGDKVVAVANISRDEDEE